MNINKSFFAEENKIFTGLMALIGIFALVAVNSLAIIYFLVTLFELYG